MSTEVVQQGYNQVHDSTSALAPGSITNTGGSQTTLSFTATEATGGTSPYAHQWSYRLSGIGSYANTGTNSLALALTGLIPGTAYDIQLTYTDGASSVVNAFLLNVTTASSTPLAAGAITQGAIGTTTIAVTATDASGGSKPYAYQYGVRLSGIGSYVNTSLTTLNGTISGLTPGTGYDIRLAYTDAVPNVVYAFLLNVTTQLPTPGNYVLNSTSDVQWLQVGDNMPVTANFSATLLATGAAAPITVASCFATVYDAALQSPVTGYIGVAATVLGSPGNTINVFIVLNCDPTISVPAALLAGQYNVDFYMTDSNGFESVCSVLVSVSELIG